MQQETTKAENKEEILLTFLMKTKDGNYAQIEESSIPYSRITEVSETIEPLEEKFYYNIS